MVDGLVKVFVAKSLVVAFFKSSGFSSKKWMMLFSAFEKKWLWFILLIMFRNITPVLRLIYSNYTICRFES